MSSTDALRALSADLSQLKGRLRQLYVQWCVGGPTLEASSALAAMAQEESGHARILARLAKDAPTTVTADELLTVEQITTWPELVGTVGPIEVALAALLHELKDLGEPEFSRNLSKIAIEERHHAQFFLGWFDELAANDNPAGASFERAREKAEITVAGWLDGIELLLVEAGVPALDLRSSHNGEEAGDVACVHCGNPTSTRTSAFGPSLMTELRKCDACGANFESVRWKSAPA